MSELVMVIEDEKEIRDLLRYNLERAGFRVAAFGDGEEGLEQLFASRPDAVVLDLMLPGRNGLEILREVRGEPATADVPVSSRAARIIQRVFIGVFPSRLGTVERRLRRDSRGRRERSSRQSGRALWQVAARRAEAETAQRGG